MAVVTGNFWDVDNPAKPWGFLNIKAISDIPVYWTDWLAALGTTHFSHTVTPEAPLEILNTTFSNGDIIFRVKLTDGAAVDFDRKYAVACHIVTTDGQEETQTVWLKIREF